MQRFALAFAVLWLPGEKQQQGFSFEFFVCWLDVALQTQWNAGLTLPMTRRRVDREYRGKRLKESGDERNTKGKSGRLDLGGKKSCQ